MKIINAIKVSESEEMCYNDDMHKQIKCEGFTLIELSLSLVFISVLSIAVVLVMTNAISTYHKGIIINRINDVGVEVADDIKSSVQGSSVVNLKSLCGDVYSPNTDALIDCRENNAEQVIKVTRHEDVTIGGRKVENVPVFGALCMGTYSYIWNSGYFFNQTDYKVGSGLENVPMATLQYKKNEGGGIVAKYAEGFRLLKVRDESRSVCESVLKKKLESGVDGKISNEFEIEGDLSDDAVDLLDESSGLALYDLTTVPSEQIGISKSIFYYTSFILGTVQGGVNVMSNGNFCATVEGYNDAVENFDYCAINKFNFAAVANGG